jgi:hypothetical protein
MPRRHGLLRGGAARRIMKIAKKLLLLTGILVAVYVGMGIYYVNIMTIYYKIVCTFPIQWNGVRLNYEDKMYYKIKDNGDIGVFFVGEESNGGVFIVKEESYTDAEHVVDSYASKNGYQVISMDNGVFKGYPAMFIEQISKLKNRIKSVIIYNKKIVVGVACREGYETRFWNVLNKIEIIDE